METHKCKLCSRTFSNGRALGGHMKAHLAALPLPPPKRQEQLFSGLPFSASSSSSSSAGEEESEEKAAVYELRENPMKSFRFADPVFAFAHDHHVGSDIVVQDRESETESRNPTRKRSKRNRKSDTARTPRRPKLTPSPAAGSPPEPEPASSVSDTSPEEDVAMCLMMLSRDKWVKRENQKQQDQNQKSNTQKETRSFGEFEELGKIKLKKLIRRKKKCEKCMKQFRSYRALSSHEKICRLHPEVVGEEESLKNGGNRRRIFKCPFCFKLFGSGQALGGHKRSHLLSSTNAANASDSLKHELSLIDLNLPAPVEEDDYSVVSDV